MCFKRGVMDACNASDDYLVREFVLSHKHDFKLGTISEPDGHDWRSFRFVLYRWAREAGMSGLAENYIVMIRKPNYMLCFIPYCLWFYIMGAEEWLSYPSAQKIEIFKIHPRIHWDPNSPVKHITRMDLISYMHEAAFAYRKTDESARVIGPGAMDEFIKALYDLTKEYVKSWK